MAKVRQPRERASIRFQSTGTIMHLVKRPLWRLKLWIMCAVALGMFYLFVDQMYNIPRWRAERSLPPVTTTEDLTKYMTGWLEPRLLTKAQQFPTLPSGAAENTVIKDVTSLETEGLVFKNIPDTTRSSNIPGFRPGKGPTKLLNITNLKIFIYPISSLLNRELATCVTRNTENKMCFDFSNDGFGSTVQNYKDTSVHSTHEYSLEVLFHEKLKMTQFVTSDPRLADLFYIPYYSALNCFCASPSMTNLDTSVWDLLLKENTYLADGKPHFMSIGTQQVQGTSSCSLPIQREFANLKYVTPDLKLPNTIHDINNTNGSGTILVPYPSYLHFNIPNTEVEIGYRPLFMFLVTSLETEDELKKTLIAQIAESQSRYSRKYRGYFHQWPSTECLAKEEHSHVIVMDLLRKGLFCLMPPGRTPLSKLCYDAVLSGCIPVIFSNFTAPFENILNYEDFTVLVDPNDVLLNGYDIVQVLRRVSKRRIKAIQQTIKTVAKYLQYGLYDGEDAFTQSLRDIVKSFKIKKFTDTRKKPAPTNIVKSNMDLSNIKPGEGDFSQYESYPGGGVPIAELTRNEEYAAIYGGKEELKKEEVLKFAPTGIEGNAKDMSVDDLGVVNMERNPFKLPVDQNSHTIPDKIIQEEISTVTQTNQNNTEVNQKREGPILQQHVPRPVTVLFEGGQAKPKAGFLNNYELKSDNQRYSRDSDVTLGKGSPEFKQRIDDLYPNPKFDETGRIPQHGPTFAPAPRKEEITDNVLKENQAPYDENVINNEQEDRIHKQRSNVNIASKNGSPWKSDTDLRYQRKNLGGGDNNYERGISNNQQGSDLGQKDYNQGVGNLNHDRNRNWKVPKFKVGGTVIENLPAPVKELVSYLPDGTKVTMNQNGVIALPNQYNTKGITQHEPQGNSYINSKSGLNSQGYNLNNLPNSNVHVRTAPQKPNGYNYQGINEKNPQSPSANQGKIRNFQLPVYSSHNTLNNRLNSQGYLGYKTQHNTAYNSKISILNSPLLNRKFFDKSFNANGQQSRRNLQPNTDFPGTRNFKPINNLNQDLLTSAYVSRLKNNQRIGKVIENNGFNSMQNNAQSNIAYRSPVDNRRQNLPYSNSPNTGFKSPIGKIDSNFPRNINGRIINVAQPTNQALNKGFYRQIPQKILPQNAQNLNVGNNFQGKSQFSPLDSNIWNRVQQPRDPMNPKTGSNTLNLHQQNRMKGQTFGDGPKLVDSISAFNTPQKDDNLKMVNKNPIEFKPYQVSFKKFMEDFRQRVKDDQNRVQEPIPGQSRGGYISDGAENQDLQYQQNFNRHYN